MINLKKMIENNLIDVNKLLLSNYYKLNLKEEELVLLMILMNDDNKCLTIKDIINKSAFNETQLTNLMSNLIERGYVSIELTYLDNGKQRETYSYENTLNRIIDAYLTNDEIVEVTKEDEIITLLENNLNRTLTPIELQYIIEWFKNKIDFSVIIDAINFSISNDSISIVKIDKYLNKKNKIEDYKNDNTIIDSFYKTWKK